MQWFSDSTFIVDDGSIQWKTFFFLVLWNV
jgi:hypothetical protein